MNKALWYRSVEFRDRNRASRRDAWRNFKCEKSAVRGRMAAARSGASGFGGVRFGFRLLRRRLPFDWHTPFNIIRLRWRKAATQGSSVDSFHQQYLLAVVNLIQLDFNNFTVSRLNRAPNKARLNR